MEEGKVDPGEMSPFSPLPPTLPSLQEPGPGCLLRGCQGGQSCEHPCEEAGGRGQGVMVTEAASLWSVRPAISSCCS